MDSDSAPEPTLLDLHFGQTPWDSLSRDELLLEVRRMFCALSRASSVLRQSALSGGPFWSAQGSGGQALARCSAIEAPLDQRYTAEAIWRSYFRYADSLLFPELVGEQGPWYAVGDTGDFLQGEGLKEGDFSPFHPDVPLRLLTFADLDPAPATAEELAESILQKGQLKSMTPEQIQRSVARQVSSSLRLDGGDTTTEDVLTILSDRE